MGLRDRKRELRDELADLNVEIQRVRDINTERIQPLLDRKAFIQQELADIAQWEAIQP